MAKAQKFMAFTGITCWIQGFGRSSGTPSRGSAQLRESSSEAANFQTMSSLSLPWLLHSQPCTHTLSLFLFPSCSCSLSLSNLLKPLSTTDTNVRDKPPRPPLLDPQDRLLMSSPHGPRPHHRQVPHHDESLGVPRHEALVATDEARGVHLGGVAAEDGLRLGGSFHGCFLSVTEMSPCSSRGVSYDKQRQLGCFVLHCLSLAWFGLAELSVGELSSARYGRPCTFLCPSHANTKQPHLVVAHYTACQRLRLLAAELSSHPHQHSVSRHPPAQIPFLKDIDVLISANSRDDDISYHTTLSSVWQAPHPMPNTSPSHLHGAPPKGAPYRWIRIRPGNIPHAKRPPS